MSYIAKFNPYRMDEDTILALATGRKRLLHQVLDTLKDNLNTTSVAQHIIIRGSRGMGKSFFLKYLQIHFNKEKAFENSEFLLLPEELSNINTPAELIKLILTQLNDKSVESTTTLWDEPSEVWQKELNNFRTYITNKRAEFMNYSLVIVIENLNELLKNIKSDKKTRKVNESRFRYLLEKIKGLTIIGATPRINSNEIDGDYNKRLFHAFKRFNLRRWTEEDYYNYFNKRKKEKFKNQENKLTSKQTTLMESKLKAISRFTGGSPRIAVVLTNLLLEDDLISTSNTIFGLIDDLTPYYRDITARIPKKSMILFDALIRKGENLSQSEIAEIVGASQNRISKAFMWLKDEGYIIGKKRENSRVFSYQVLDRIHVLYYQQREIYHNKNTSPIWLLSDFLVSFYQEKELKDFTNRYLKEYPGKEVDDMAKLYLQTVGYSKDELNKLQEPQAIYRKYNKESIKSDLLLFIKNSVVEENDLIRIISDLDISDKLLNIYIKDIIDEFDKEKTIREKSVLLLKLGRVFMDIHKYYESNIVLYKAFELLESIESEIVDYKDDFVKNQNEFPFYIKKITELLGRIGYNLTFMKKYKESIIFHRAVHEYIDKSSNYNERVRNFGRLALNYIMMEDWDEVYKLLEADSEYQNQCNLFKEFSKSIGFAEKNISISVAFAIGNKLMSILKQRAEKMSIVLCLNMFFANLSQMNLSSSLLIDLAEEALSIFTGENEQLVINTVLHTTKYIETGKNPVYLEKLNPDIVITIKSIVNEWKL